MADGVRILMPLQIPQEVLRVVREHPETRCNDKDEENRRIGWLLSAWDVMVAESSNTVME